MQQIEPALMGQIVNATAAATSDEEYMSCIVDGYMSAYDLNQLDEVDHPRLADIFHRLNAFQGLKSDDRFEAVFSAGKNTVFGKMMVCVVEAEYEVNDEGLAAFNPDEVIEHFLRIVKPGSH